MDPSGSQEKKIPRFASFKPQISAPTRDVSESRDRHLRKDEERIHTSGRKSEHRRRRDCIKDAERPADHRERRDRDRSEVHTVTRTLRKESLSATPTASRTAQDGQDLFVIDRTGDRHNLTYGTLHRYSVPIYHRVGRGSVLGLPRRYRIDRDTSTGDALVVRADLWRHESKRTKLKDVLHKSTKQRPRLLRARAEFVDDPGIATRDYIPLRHSHRDREIGVGELDSDEDRYAYRSIQGKAKDVEHPSSDAEGLSEAVTTGDEDARQDPDKQVKRLNAELLRAVDKTPQDIDAWMRLIDHQEVFLIGASTESRVLSQAEQTSLADIRLSLYDKALKKVGQCAQKDRLLIGRLDEGMKLWEKRKAAEQWQSTLRSNPQFVSLWTKYLDFLQTEFLDFTYERCLATFTECMNLIASIGDISETPYIQVYVFLRMTLFMRESGFSEQAAGLWQAVLEFVLFRPPDLSRSEDLGQTLSAFKTFWETEVARIGEVGAKGWNSSSGVPVELGIDKPLDQVDPRSVFPSWVASERHQTVAGRLPGRSLDESDIDDPFRVVLFSDIEHTISLFWKFDRADALVDGFLQFCHLPPLTTQMNANVTRRWAGDAFIHNFLMDNPAFSFSDWFAGRDRDSTVDAGTLGSFAHRNFINTVDSLFADKDSWHSSFGAKRRIAMNEQSQIDSGWVRRVLRLLVDAFPDNDDLAEYSLAVEFLCDAKEAKKHAKALLKKRSSSLRLYNCYALVGRRLGNSKAADNVWATSLSMTQGFSQNEQVDSILLWRTWILEMLETGQKTRACHLLQAVPQKRVELSSLERDTDQVFTPTLLLKIQNFLAQGQEIALNRKSSLAFVAYADCSAMLAYLAHAADMDKALQVYSGAIAKLGSVSVHEESFALFTTELLHQYRARLLYHHMTTSAIYKSSLIRDVLTESISQFPHNTMFLSLFAWNESRFRIEERVRSVLREITVVKRSRSETYSSSTASGPIPITSHFFSIFTEVSRPVYAGSTLHSVRAAFENAIGDSTQARSNDNSRNTRSTSQLNSTSSGRFSPSLWKLYILFELSRGQIQRAKDVFYRGMRACPWSKDLLLLAFTHLRADVVDEGPMQGLVESDSGMHFEELRRVYHVLVEKGLRIRVDIEDMLDEVADQMNMDMDKVMGLKSMQDSVRGPIRMPEDAESEDNEEEEEHEIG